MNATGIPTTAYQVLHLLTEVGYPPPLAVGVPPQSRSYEGVSKVGYPHWGTTIPGLKGVPNVEYPHWGTPPVGVPPQLDLARVFPRLDLAQVPPPPPAVDSQTK